jgi:translation initiation factor 5B
MIRQPIVVFMGHVDHGKTTLADSIRHTAVAKSEPGAITQCISSSKIGLKAIQDVCGKLLEKLNIKITIPGLLFIDTPGHAAFQNLRKRGGNLADIAVLVIDINEGIKPQTLESIEILKQYKTPFIIALNKIDLISGWRSLKKALLQSINEQSEFVKREIDEKLYTLVSKLHELGFNPERFDRVEDYTKQIAIVPVSAKTSDGIPELLMILTGLAQKYLEKELKIKVEGPGKATILEVKEEKGLGKTLDIILHDGSIKINDAIVIGSLEKPVVTKVKALFEPENKKLKSLKEITAASGLKLSAPNLENILPGMPLIVANENLEQAKINIQKEVEQVIIETDKSGVIIKAESLGSLEAMINILKQNNIPIRKTSIGNITKKDILETSAESEPLNKVILGFNVSLEAEETPKDVKVITNNVIYKIIEDLLEWREEKQKEIQREQMADLVMPFKIKILPNCIFHQSHPAIVGVEILAGKVKNDVPVIKDKKSLSYIKELQSEGKTVQEAVKGEEVAVSLPNLTAGRQIKENDILYSDMSEENFKKLRELKKYLNADEIQTLKEIQALKRKTNPMWGI